MPSELLGERDPYSPRHHQRASPNADMPDEIAADHREGADHREAADIVARSPRGAAALLRLCIQKLCRHLGKPGRDINSDIAEMVREGLPASIQKALDIVRVTGNEAVHPGELELMILTPRGSCSAS
jgi:hypothetical protein